MKNKLWDIGLVFVIGFLIGNIYINLSPKESVKSTVVKKSEVLQIADGYSVLLESINNQRFVTLTYNDFEYIVKNKKVKKEILYKINGIFVRIEDGSIYDVKLDK